MQARALPPAGVFKRPSFHRLNSPSGLPAPVAKMEEEEEELGGLMCNERSGTGVTDDAASMRSPLESSSSVICVYLLSTLVAWLVQQQK